MMIEPESETTLPRKPFTYATNLKLEHPELLTYKDSVYFKTPEHSPESRGTSPIAFTSKSCGVPLPKPMLTVPKKTPGTPELLLGSSSMELNPTDLDRELGQILHLLASASVRVKALQPSRKRIQPISLDTTQVFAPSKPFLESPELGRHESGGIMALQEQARAMLHDYNLRTRIGKTQHTRGGMDTTLDRSP